MCQTPPSPLATELKCHEVMILAPVDDSMADRERLAVISSVAGGPVHDPGDPDSQVQHAERFES